MPIPTIPVFLAVLAAVSVHQLPCVNHVLLWPLPTVMDLAPAPQKHTSLYHSMESDIVLNADLTASPVSMPTLAPLARLHTPKQLITNVFVQLETMLV